MDAQQTSSGGLLSGVSSHEDDVTIWIDNYDDLFSDFDPRPFEQRAISDDFVLQVKKVAKESKGKIHLLHILVPEAAEKSYDNKVIRKRIERFFTTMFEKLREDVRKARSRGIALFLSGVVLMMISGYLNFLELSSLWKTSLLVLTEPGGWFLFWSGLDLLFNYARNRNSELSFYRNMSTVHVQFQPYR